MVSESISPLNMNTKEVWESYFQDGWEKNKGREQTRIFAYYFIKTVRLPSEARSLLDVSCAMGDGLLEIHNRYPHLQLSGCDISEFAIKKAKEDYGSIARFINWSFDEIEGYYDIIYCSATLEHFESYMQITRKLLTHCKWLYILVPYKELRYGKPLTVEPGEWHVATFYRNSYNQLLNEGCVERIRKWVRYTPGAWGNGSVPIWQKCIALLTGHAIPDEYRMIFFELLPSGGTD